MSVVVRPAEQREQLRCAYCHDAADPAEPCDQCGVLLHVDCWAETKRCPTLGCEPQAPQVVVHGVRDGYTSSDDLNPLRVILLVVGLGGVEAAYAAAHIRGWPYPWEDDLLPVLPVLAAGWVLVAILAALRRPTRLGMIGQIMGVTLAVLVFLFMAASTGIR